MKKFTNKEQLAAYANYKTVINLYGYRRLGDCYKVCSVYKQRAERDILSEMDRVGDIFPNSYACDYAIIGYNSFSFSCGYMIYTPDEHDESIAHATFVYHTASRRELIEIS